MPAPHEARTTATRRHRLLTATLAIVVGTVSAVVVAVGTGPAGAVPLHALVPRGCIEDTGLSGCGTGHQTPGLLQARTVAVSPDGRSVYVVARTDHAIVRFDRDADGTLTPAGCIEDVGASAGCASQTAGLGGAFGVAVSPDGKSVYVASQNDMAIVRFNRAASGALTPMGCVEDIGLNACGAGNQTAGLGGTLALTVSPDGASVYAVSFTDDAIVRFNRAADGALQAAGCVENTGLSGCGGGQQTAGLNGPLGLTVSPDGRSVYVASQQSQAVVRFNRAGDGALTPAGCIEHVQASACGAGNQTPAMNGADSVAVSPDGRSVYVAAGEGSIVQFDRYADGALRPVGCIEDVGQSQCGAGNQTPGLGNVQSVVVSPDGASVYASSQNDAAVVSFDRAPDGDLSPLGCIEDLGLSGCGSGNQVPGLGVAQRLAISPDGANVYVAAAGDSSVVTFSRELPPVCRPRASTGLAGTNQTVALSCADPNGDPFDLLVASDPDHGALSAINQAGDTVVYKPDPGFAGLDVFSYRARSDGKDSNVVTVTILVDDGPDLVALMGDDRYTAREGTRLRLRFSTSDAATARVDLRRGTRTIATVKRSVDAGTTTFYVPTEGTSTRLDYTLVLKVTAPVGRVATDRASLRIVR